jgi:N-acetylneuraminate synthase
LVILGKGASVDDLDTRCLNDAFVIGLNDAELLGPTDVTILHEEWVFDLLLQPSASLYLSNLPAPRITSFDQRAVFLADYEPLTQSNSELMFQRVFSESLVIEEVMFLTALRIAYFAWRREKCPVVYLVGFDFSTETGFGKKFAASASGRSRSTQRQKIEMQESIFLEARELMRQAGVEVFHVGYREFSDMTPGAFSERLLNTLAIARETLSSRGGGVLVTAEITTNHLGDLDRAKSMMRLAHASGANLVKFQMRDVESFYSTEVLDGPYPSSFGTTFREYREGLELSNESFSELGKLAKELGVGWFLSVLDGKSLNRAIDLGLNMIKVPGTMSRKRDFIREVVENFDGDLVFSTGMTSSKYVEWLMGLVGGTRRVFLLHTNSAYPTPTEDCNVRVVSNYSRLAKEFPNVVPGYSSHDDGWFGSVLAVASGAKMIEKHVKLGTSKSAHFDSVALDLETNEFRDYVSHIRKAEIALGDGIKRITPSEHHKY